MLRFPFYRVLEGKGGTLVVQFELVVLITNNRESEEKRYGGRRGRVLSLHRPEKVSHSVPVSKFQFASILVRPSDDPMVPLRLPQPQVPSILR